MQVGRSRDDYQTGEFRELIVTRRKALGLGMAALASLADMHLATLSKVERGLIPCPRPQRYRLMQALQVNPEVAAKFVRSSIADVDDAQLSYIDPGLSAEASLQRGQGLMMRGYYADARKEFRRVFNAAGASGNFMLQADAAGRCGWSHAELEECDDARRCLLTSIDLVQRATQLSVTEIIRSISASRPTSGDTESAAKILSRAFQTLCKILAVRAVYEFQPEYAAEAKAAVTQAAALDERLEPVQVAYDLRWQAVAQSAEPGTLLKEIDDVLLASRERVSRGSLAEVSIMRERGVVRWRKSHLKKAQEFLSDAADGFTVFADQRALGSTFSTLSRVVAEQSDVREARRYALAAASLHPYGHVLENARRNMLAGAASEVQHDIQDLVAGKAPFHHVHRVLKALAHGEAVAIQIIRKNVAAVVSQTQTLH